MKMMMNIFLLLVLSQASFGFELTEVMYNPPGTDSGREWVEFLSDNLTNPASLYFFDNSGLHDLVLILGNPVIYPGNLLVITNDDVKFVQEYPDFSGHLFKSSFSLLNSGEAVGLVYDNVEIVNRTYPSDMGDGNNRTAEFDGVVWSESIVDGGTPGFLDDVDVPEFSPFLALLVLCLGVVLFQYLRK